MKPRLLDLFCGAGGAAMGYHRAGFEVVGVDINPQPHYPFEFHLADALDRGFLMRLNYGMRLHDGPSGEFSAVADQHPNLIPTTRDILREWGLPYVIENVMGAPLENPVMLCGTMFEGLKVYRHRIFETKPDLYWPPYHNPHLHRPAEVGRPVPEHGWMTVAGHFSDAKAGGRAMGIDWMTKAELAQAIPPAYTEWIGRQLIAALAVAA